MSSNTALISCLKTCNLEQLESIVTDLCVSGCLGAVGLTWEAENEAPEGLGVVASILLVTLILVPLCAVFSGLTLGLLSLDMNGLKVLEEGGDPAEREHARLITPIREKGNLLLCVLLTGNTIVNAATSIIVADITSGITGLIISTTLIVLFGEIVPQSICTRHGLRIGATLIPLVKIFTYLLFPIAYPISLALDYFVGRDIGTVYSQEELMRLIELHCTDPDAQRESGLTHSDHRLLMGALSFKRKSVRSVMTPLRDCFMLAHNLRLNFQTMLAIYKSGFTRIPVFEGVHQNIIGILYSKDLILVDPDDEIEVGAVLSLRSRDVGHVRCVPDDSALEAVFNQIMASNNHMLIATRGASGGTAMTTPLSPGESANNAEPYDAPCYDADPTVVVGLITLEDIIEEVLQAEIQDESDRLPAEEGNNSRRGAHRVELDKYLSMFEHKLAAARALSPQEIQAIAAFLSASVQEFSGLASSNVALMGLIRHSEVMERDAPNKDASCLVQRALSHSVSVGEVSGSTFGELAKADPALVLYRRGERSATFTLILQGRVLIHTGAESFEMELGPWSVLGQKALSTKKYVPDFDAVALPPCRLLRIPQSAYGPALDSTRLPPIAPFNAMQSSGPQHSEALSVSTASGITKQQHPTTRRKPSSWLSQNSSSGDASQTDRFANIALCTIRNESKPVEQAGLLSRARSVPATSSDLNAAAVGLLPLDSSNDDELEQQHLLQSRDLLSDAV